MKILQLNAQNIKNLKAVEIRPDGSAIVLEGKNGAGKSAILDCIFTTLTGKKLEDPIRHGEEKAEVVVDLGDLIVKKKWTQKGEYLEVANKDGAKYSAPQQKLNERIGSLSFDPLAFKDMKAQAQVDYLKDLVGLDFTESLDKEKAAFDERTAVNRVVKEKLLSLSSIPEPDPAIGTEEISMADGLAVVKDLRAKRDVFLKSRNDLDSKEEAVEHINQEIIDRQKRIELLVEEIEQLKGTLESNVKRAADHLFPEEITEERIEKAENGLQNLEATNQTIRSAANHRTYKKHYEDAVKDADMLTTMIEEYKADRSKQVRDAQYPVYGLSITEDGVDYSGVLFSRLSTGQQVKVSTAIAMALNPDLRVILIREGSLLDCDNLAAIVEMAKDKDYQIWIEKTEDEKSSGIFIEDGSVREGEAVV